MNWSAVLFVNGVLLAAIGALMCIPMFLEFCLSGAPPVSDFLLPIGGCIFIGFSLFFANKQSGPIKIGTTDAFLLTSLIWVLSPLFAGLPFYCCQPLELSFIDSWYEGASALTTTGCTMIRDSSVIPRWILMWRLVLSYVGGVGIILMGMIVFPILRIGGMQLFRTEYSDKNEKIMPSVTQISVWLVGVYTGLIMLSFLALNLAGLPLEESICYAISTISTCGLSIRTDSLVSNNNAWSEFIMFLSMILGGSSLTLLIKMIRGNIPSLNADQQLKGYFKVLVGVSCVTMFLRWYNSDLTILRSFREGAFNAVSFMTTTGLFNSNYNSWGPFAAVLFPLISVIGGCTGSTSGGIKIFRFQILFAYAKTHVLKLRRPHGVFIPMYNEQKITEPVATSILVFIALYVISIGVAALGLAIFGADFNTAFSAAISAIGNVGSGLNGFTGGAKVVLIFCMILGRLELLTLLTLLVPSFWRR
jgi:trk system potassium uptake protein TrkH